MTRWLAACALVALGGCRQLLGFDSPSSAIADVRAPDSPVFDANDADDRVCLGAAPYVVCVTRPTAPVQLASSATIDTNVCAIGTAVIVDGDPACVLAATSIVIAGNVRATGAPPLVLLATDTLELASGSLDVSSTASQVGAGTNPTCAPGSAPTTGPQGGGGGAGGTFGTAGGNGGGGSSGGAAGGRAPPAAGSTLLRGGCSGQTGAAIGGALPAAGGNGGGAIYLLAGARLELDFGTTVNASGAGAPGGPPVGGGGGGGGSGGLILLWTGGTVSSSGIVIANGGGGGGGANSTNMGKAGQDPSNPQLQAAGGAGGGASNGGPGGDGYANPFNATSGSDGGLDGGGGGGGGAGVISVLSGGPLGGMVSPPSH